jgi:hypothetical protein
MPGTRAVPRVVRNAGNGPPRAAILDGVTPPSARRMEELVDKGHAALGRGDPAAAVPPLREAAAIGRQLLEAAPDDDQRAYALGRALYALANALTVTPDLPGAVAALDEAARCYGGLPGPAGRALVADVRLRRARTRALQGAGASAVVDAQAAIVGYVRISTAERVDEHYLGFARVAMWASDVLAAYGDPEVALAAAREGLSWAVRAVNDGIAVRDAALTGAMVQALSVEIALLERLGRGAETANAAGALAFLGAPRVRVLLDERGVPGLSPDDGGVPAAVRTAGLLAPDPRGTLPDLLLRHPVGPVITPAFRAAPELLVPAAEAAAGAAVTLLANGVAAGLRLGLEAHYLFAFVHEEVVDGRFAADPRTERSGLTWCRLLAGLATRAEAGGDGALARDLAGWGVRAFLLLDPSDDSPARVAALAGPTAVFERLGAI